MDETCTKDKEVQWRRNQWSFFFDFMVCETRQIKSPLQISYKGLAEFNPLMIHFYQMLTNLTMTAWHEVLPLNSTSLINKTTSTGLVNEVYHKLSCLPYAFYHAYRCLNMIYVMRNRYWAYKQSQSWWCCPILI